MANKQLWSCWYQQLYVYLRCVPNWYAFKSSIVMMIVSARDFRGEQGKYLQMVSNGESVVIKSRDHGSFKLVPITEDDTLVSKTEFLEKLRIAELEIKEGKGKRFNAANEAIQYLDSL